MRARKIMAKRLKSGITNIISLSTNSNLTITERGGMMVKDFDIYVSCNDYRCINYYEDMCTPTVGAPKGSEFDIVPQVCLDFKCDAETCSKCKEIKKYKSKCSMFKKGTSDWYDETKEEVE